MSTANYESSRKRARDNAAFQREQTRLHGRCDVRSMLPKAAKNLGKLACSAWGNRGTKNGVPL